MKRVFINGVQVAGRGDGYGALCVGGTVTGGDSVESSAVHVGRLFERVDLSGGYNADSVFVDCRFDRCDLRAVFSRCRFVRCRFEKCDVGPSEDREPTCWPGSVAVECEVLGPPLPLTGTRAYETADCPWPIGPGEDGVEKDPVGEIFVGRELVNARDAASWEESVHVGCDYEDLVIQGHNLTDAVFVGCRLRGVDLYWANAFRAAFVDTEIAGCDLRGNFDAAAFVRCRIADCETGDNALGGKTEWAAAVVRDCGVSGCRLPVVPEREAG